MEEIIAASREAEEYAVDAYGESLLINFCAHQPEVDEKIVDETMKEFVSEGKIWWAFVRFGVAFDRVATLTGREDETNLLLWPVASACINTNPKIEQTEGYN